MSASGTKIGLTVLQWALGVVVLIEAVLFAMPSALTTLPGLTYLVSCAWFWRGVRSSAASCS